MQLCESCGACRENEWQVCPFCRAPLATSDAPPSADGERFDALAAAAETTDLAALPSQMTDDAAEDEPDANLITAQDLAHLTGDGGPATNAWESVSPPPPAVAAETNDGIDAPVSRAVVFPLVAVALVAVVFVAYSILSASPAIRPDTVAFIDRTTTTLTPTTTTPQPPSEPGVGTVGVDVAEQAGHLCSGDQFSIARAEEPSLAIYNDVLIATRDGRDDWVAPADQVTLRHPIPSLIGCLTTADGGEIDRCPVDGYVISRRSVAWTYRVLQTIDGTELGSDSGTATEVPSCDDLLLGADGEDIASWSPLPQDRLDEVAVAYTAAPHPSVACATGTARTVSPKPATVSSSTVPTTAPPLTAGLSLHATFANVTDMDVALPEGWMATLERPVEAVLCLEVITTTKPADRPEALGNSSTTIPIEADSPVAEECSTTIQVTAQHRDGQPLGSWTHISPTCTSDETVTLPVEWWVEVVGPELGYVVESSEGE